MGCRGNPKREVSPEALRQKLQFLGRALGEILRH